MRWEEVGKKLLNIGLPALGTALGGPAGGLAAKTALSLISSKLGIEEKNLTPANITNIAANPDQLVKLKEIEADYGLEIKRLYFDDLRNARQREIEITKVTGKRDINLYALAWTVIAGFFVMTGMMYFKPLPESAIGPINQLFGALAAGFGMVLNYFYGSSRSSADKTKLLANK